MFIIRYALSCPVSTPPSPLDLPASLRSANLQTTALYIAKSAAQDRKDTFQRTKPKEVPTEPYSIGREEGRVARRLD